MLYSTNSNVFLIVDYGAGTKAAPIYRGVVQRIERLVSTQKVEV